MGEKTKKPFYKKWWVWVIVIIIIGALATSGEDEQPTTVNNNDNSSESSDTDTSGTEEPVQEEFAVGDSVQLGDNVLTVTNVEKSAGDDFDTPQAGKEYVIVTVQIDNSGDENISYNPFDFQMANSQGQIVDQAFTIINSDTALESGELAPGGTVSGTIAFEQPAGDTGLQLQYSPSFWSDDVVKVNLQ